MSPYVGYKNKIYKVWGLRISMKEFLREIGLTDGEINVYMALLELGSSTVGPIIRKSGVSGSKVYIILDKLIKKGLVSSIYKGNVRYFEAESPMKINEYIEQKEIDIKKQKEEFQKILPKLLLKKELTKAKQSKMVVYEGWEGTKTAFNDILQTLHRGDKYYVIGVPETSKRSQRFMLRFYRIRAKKGIGVKVLMNSGTRKIGNQRKKIPFTEIRYLPKDMLTPATLNIYSDKTIISMGKTEPKITILIRSDEITQSFKTYFNLLWKSSTK